jgi:hypothetical protein
MGDNPGGIAPFLSIEKNPKIFYKDNKGASPVPTYKVGAGGRAIAIFIYNAPMAH